MLVCDNSLPPPISTVGIFLFQVASLTQAVDCNILVVGEGAGIQFGSSLIAIDDEKNLNLSIPNQGVCLLMCYCEAA